MKKIIFYLSGILLTFYYELFYFNGVYNDTCNIIEKNINNFSLMDIDKNNHNYNFLKIVSFNTGFFSRSSSLILLNIDKKTNNKNYSLLFLERYNNTVLIRNKKKELNELLCSNETSNLYFHTNWIPIYSTEFLLSNYMNNLYIYKKYYNYAKFYEDIINNITLIKVSCLWKFGIRSINYCKEIG